MVGADADPPTAHGRCWVTVEQLGMWPLDHGCCSFIPRVENKKRFLQMPLRKAIFTCFFRSYRDLCKYIYHTIEYNSLKKNASVFPALCPNTQHLLVIRQKYLHQNQPSFSQIHRTLLRTPPAPRFPTRNSTLQPSPCQGRPLLTPLKNRTHNVIVIIMFIMLIMFIMFIIVLLLSLLKHKCRTNICGIRC